MHPQRDAQLAQHAVFARFRHEARPARVGAGVVDTDHDLPPRGLDAGPFSRLLLLEVEVQGRAAGHGPRDQLPALEQDQAGIPARI